ncbi:MAG: dephospho-CoA kinase [Thermodesulfobacteriota bacterium]
MLVGLTGGVASGKSLVTEEFKRLGAHVIDADLIAREVVEPGSPAFRRITEAFGPEVIAPDGTLRRRHLASLVFGDPERLKRLNEITHPPIRRRIEEEVARTAALHPGEVVVIDAALLIENGLHKRVSRVVVVFAPEAEQVKRLITRDGLTEEEARGRLASQMPLSEKSSLADFVIDNSGDPDRTRARARAVFKELKKECEDKRA